MHCNMLTSTIGSVQSRFFQRLSFCVLRSGRLFPLSVIPAALAVFALCGMPSLAFGQQVTYEVVKAFDLVDPVNGYSPYGALIQASDGSFYGTTANGPGSFGFGTIFRIDVDPVTLQAMLTTLHSFNGVDGANPRASLIQASDGTFYGTTFAGGDFGYGTVFHMETAGTLTTVTKLHSFDLNDGARPGE